MPPKNEKKQVKEKEKVVEDKTFGMKNKNKSVKVQKFIEGMKASTRTAPVRTKEQQESDFKTKKVEAEKAALLTAIFGAQPTKKKKKEAKPDDGKIDLYTDQRSQQLPSGETEETMANWDQQKLEEVVNSKHAAQDANKTDIVCKFFLEAVQKSLYGWFWICPNGESCKYRHALPPGYVLKKPDSLNVDSDEEEVPLEERLEQERAALPQGGTPVTEETFKAWLLKKAAEKAKAVEEAEAAKGKKKDGNRNMASGKQLFVMDPSLFVDDDGAASDYEISDHEGLDSEDEDHPMYDINEEDEEDESEDQQDEESEDQQDDE